MKMRFKSLFIAGLFFICTPYFAFCKTLIYCSEASPDYFNPQMSFSGVAFDASNLLYNRLVEFDKQGDKLVPSLAKKWTLSKDKKTYTFYLRKKVSFYSQGAFKPSRYFNADDVLFSFRRQKNKSHPFYSVNGGNYKFFQSLNLRKHILKIKKINKYTVQFVLKQPVQLFPVYMTMDFAAILSKEYGDFLIKKDKKSQIDFKPVGTGPFILTKYVKGQLIRYKRHDKYYLGPSKIQKLVFVITTDASVRFQKLKRKECHILAKPQFSDIPAIKKHKNIRVIQNKAHNLAYLSINLEKPPLGKLLVRKAIAHALNRKLYIKAIYQGFANITDSPVPPSLWGYNPKVKLPEYSPKKARALLKKAGLSKGFKIKLWTLPISRPYNPNGKKMGELMQADLKKVGIQAELVTYDWASYIAKSLKGEHELIQYGWMADIPDPSSFLQILLSCDSVAYGSNVSKWCDKTYDSLVQKAQKQSNKKLAAVLYKQAQLVFQEQIPFIPLAYTYRYSAISTDVKNYYLRSFGSEKFHHLSLK